MGGTENVDRAARCAARSVLGFRGEVQGVGREDRDRDRDEDDD